MKPFYFAMLLLAGTVSCVDATPSLQLTQTVAPDENCVFSENNDAVAAGSLNLGLAPNYPVGLTFAANLGEEDVTVGDAPVRDPDTNTIYITAMELEYAATDAAGAAVDLGAAASAEVPLYGVAPPNATGLIAVNLFTANALGALGTVLASGRNPLNVRVTLRLTGETLTGSSVESNEIVFPVEVGSSVFRCPDGQQEVADSRTCLTGLNGNRPECEAAQ